MYCVHHVVVEPYGVCTGSCTPHTAVLTRFKKCNFSINGQTPTARTIPHRRCLSGWRNARTSGLEKDGDTFERRGLGRAAQPLGLPTRVGCGSARAFRGGSTVPGSAEGGLCGAGSCVMFARAAVPWSRATRPAFVCRRAAVAVAAPCRHSTSGSALLFKLTGRDQLGVVWLQPNLYQ